MDKLSINIAGEIALSKDPGSSMKKWREIFGISQVNLANHLKISSSTLSDYEGGRRKSPGIGVVSKYINALMEVDRKAGSKVLSQLQKDVEPVIESFEVHEFSSSIPAIDFAKKIDAVTLANGSKLKNTKIYGFTLIDSIKFILDVPVHDYFKVYGKTPGRALIFQKVEYGRSPLIASKISRFNSDLKPSIIVLHSDKKPEEIDVLAIKIAESEKIPLLLTSKPVNDILYTFKKFME